MSLGPMADALAPLRARLGRPIREREVLRVAATITHVDPKDAIQTARRDVLNWAQQRCGGALPKSAWDGEGFEYFAAGRTTLGARLTDNAVELWALRGDDPDKTVPGRIWTTEIAIGRQDGELPHLSVRLLVASPEEEPDFVPAVPRLVRQIAADCGLSAGGFPLSDVPRRVSSDEDLAVLIDVLEAPSRRLPVFVASGDERALDPARPLIDVDTLARATIGLAHVVVLPAPFTYGLSDAFGKVRSCYHGAVRVYLPGFDSASDPYEHPLTLGEFALRDSAAIVAWRNSSLRKRAYVAHGSAKMSLPLRPCAAQRFRFSRKPRRLPELARLTGSRTLSSRLRRFARIWQRSRPRLRPISISHTRKRSALRLPRRNYTMPGNAYGNSKLTLFLAAKEWTKVFSCRAVGANSSTGATRR